MPFFRGFTLNKFYLYILSFNHTFHHVVTLFIAILLLSSASLVIAAPPDETRPYLELPFPGHTQYKVTCGYGCYQHRGSMYYAVDFAIPEGDPIMAAAAGEVMAVTWELGLPANLNLGDALIVYIDHGDGWFTRYVHLDGITVRVGDQVEMGDVIGYGGKTGASGDHLHFELKHGFSRHSPSVPINELFGGQEPKVGQRYVSNNWTYLNRALANAAKNTPIPTPTTPPTATPSPLIRVVPPTPTLVPSPTPVVPPTATPSLVPSPTPVVPPTATPTLVPSPTPEVPPTATSTLVPSPIAKVEEQTEEILRSLKPQVEESALALVPPLVAQKTPSSSEVRTSPTPEQAQKQPVVRRSKTQEQTQNAPQVIASPTPEVTPQSEQMITSPAPPVKEEFHSLFPRVESGLTLSAATIQAGTPVTATFMLRNTTQERLHLTLLGVAGRTRGKIMALENTLFFDRFIVLNPGRTYQFNKPHIFEDVGEFELFIFALGPQNEWIPLDGANQTAPLRVKSGLMSMPARLTGMPAREAGMPARSTGMPARFTLFLPLMSHNVPPARASRR